MKTTIYHILTKAVAIGLLVTASSCESFLDIDDPKSLVSVLQVYSDDVTATAAITGIYNELMNTQGFASGSNVSVSALAGLSADELLDFSRKNNTNLQFEQNRILPTNASILTLWNSMYTIIYQCNAALTGIEASTGLTPVTKSQLTGESKLIRAFANFYLVNLFGDVPLITATDYEMNSRVTRVSADEVYAKIITDLQEASTLMGNDYPAIEDDLFTKSRARANRYCALALLARVYLYRGVWQKAEEAATEVIEASDKYVLVQDLNSVFLKNSSEAIWQIQPQTPGTTGATNEAYYFVNFNPNYNILRLELLNSFEDGDLRRSAWTSSTTDGNGEVSYAYKYKQSDPFGPLLEYSTQLRLAEMYLIRAEASARLGNISASVEDVDAIRARAGLASVTEQYEDISAEQLLTSIAHERRVELFTESGHRWLDLKRTGQASIALSGLKGQWDGNDELYPLPQSEFEKNNALGLQNKGY